MNQQNLTPEGKPLATNAEGFKLADDEFKDHFGHPTITIQASSPESTVPKLSQPDEDSMRD